MRDVLEEFVARARDPYQVPDMLRYGGSVYSKRTGMALDALPSMASLLAAARAWWAERGWCGPEPRERRAAPQRPVERHAPRLAALRAVTRAKCLPRVCACGCGRSFVPNPLGLKRIFFEKACKWRRQRAVASECGD